MSSFFSFIIIIVAILIKVLGNQNSAARKKQVNQTGQNQRNVTQPRQQVQRTTQAQRDAYYYNQQAATKDRLRQKYGTQTNSGQQKPVQRGDILSKAKGNVKENEPDRTQQQMHAEVCRDYRDTAHPTSNVAAHKKQSVECDTGAESDIIKKVNDLIVTGYSGDMHFDRDFIAEGVEMLNRFSL